MKATHVCYTNVEVDMHNDHMLNILNEILEEMNADVTPKNIPAKINPKTGQIDKTQFVKKLRLKRGARVMIISNINIRDSLVNGSLGMILDIKKNADTGTCL